MRIKPFGLLVVGSNGVRIRRDATEHVSYTGNKVIINEKATIK